MMSNQESTVLLVDPASLPSRLEEALSARSCFVETAEVDQLSGTLLVSTPDLIIAAQKHIVEACRCIRTAQLPRVLPLLLVAPRGALSHLRLNTPEEVSAVVPFDMPAAAIAVRAQTLLKRAGVDVVSSDKEQNLSAPQKAAFPAKKRGDERKRPPLALMQTLLGTGDPRPPETTPSSPVKEHVAFAKTLSMTVSPDRERSRPLAPMQSRSSKSFGRGEAASTSLAGSAKPIVGAGPRDEFSPKAGEMAASLRRADLQVSLDEQQPQTIPLGATSAPAVAPLEPREPVTQSSKGSTVRKKTSSDGRAKMADEPSAAQRSLSHSAPQGAAISVTSKTSPGLGVAKPDGVDWIGEAPTKANTRVSLEMPATALPGLRVALLDEDVTRADAISSSLREAGHKVFLVSNTSGVTRWALLRRFSPQVILVDEQSLARDGGQWLGQFRADAFLRTTSLVACPLESVFDARRGTTNLSPLTPQLEGIGRIELALVAQLSPDREVEILGKQMSPARLLSLLCELGKSVSLECTTEEELMSWPLKDGQVGRARVRPISSPVDAPRERTLSPEDALMFLLDHADATVVVQERHAISLSGGRGVAALLDAAFSWNLPAAISQTAVRSIPPPAIPVNYPSLAPPQAMSGARAQETMQVDEEDLSPDSEQPTRPIRLDEILGLKAQMKRSVPTSQASSVPPPAPASVPPPAPHLAMSSSGDVARSFDDDSSMNPVNSDGAPASDEGSRHTPPGISKIIPAEIQRKTKSVAFRTGMAAVVLGALAEVLTVAFASDDKESAEAAAAPADPKNHETADLPAPTPAKPPAPSSDKAQPSDSKVPVDLGSEESDENDDVAFFRVKTAGELASCEKVLKQPLSYYQERPPWEGQALWKRARHQLLIGEKETSHHLMCQAAFIDPSGPASVGLASYYLANRSLENAQAWALYGIEQRPDFPRKSQELLGDVLSQMGKVNEARDIWLKTMNLDQDDHGKLDAVARTLTISADKARRGGDYPLAERLLRRAVVFDEENGVAAAGFAVALYKNDQPHLAKKWARRALSLDAQSGGALYVLGELAADGGNQAEARRNFSQIPAGSSFFKEAEARLKTF